MENEIKNEEKRGVFGVIADGFKESTRAAHEISKEKFRAEKAAARERHLEATAPHPGMAEVKEAKGFKGKVKAIAKSMKDDCDYAKEQERQFRKDAISLKNTKATLAMIDMIQEAIMGGIPSYARKGKNVEEKE